MAKRLKKGEVRVTVTTTLEVAMKLTRALIKIADAEMKKDGKEHG